MRRPKIVNSSYVEFGGGGELSWTEDQLYWVALSCPFLSILSSACHPACLPAFLSRVGIDRLVPSAMLCGVLATLQGAG